MERKKILIADDEPKILKFLAGFLQREGFAVATAANGFDALAEFNRWQPDLLVLDVMMPKMDGYEVCRKIREQSNVPIIFLTAKNETFDKIMGLTLGSDDYLTKPFDSAELLLRIRAILRRVADNSSVENKDVIKVPGLVINRATRTVEFEGKEIELTPKEFDLLWLLASHPNQVFTRDQLIYQIWDTEYCEDTGIVTTLVKRLREKIELDTANPRYIKTIRGVGYKFGVKPC
ncbi:two component transcriptional regulator, winged helix family [Thermincola ferriacetica]|uniref:Stage 0 sporulation protein A homolog n=2 Tax=Thermincola TaxID=278993 RepID=D5XEI9_THEPJ|nr:MULTISPECIES: response regulator transcription factor [Thermincola]ADG82060.1 two component transcriptional regulator, winged helix family [Thermincola potens JR]KNZ71079.1 two component transcriptional regulator, winged helix family [Thermincola ferriacetica]